MSATSDPTDAKADGQFQNRRAGYSSDKLGNAEYWARKGGTLNAGEGAILCQEIDRLREQLTAAQRVVEAAIGWSILCDADARSVREEEAAGAVYDAARKYYADLGEPWDAAITAAKEGK